MKNIVCPVSPERVAEHIPRINALLVIFTIGLYFIFNTWFLPLLLVIDFFIRGFGNAHYSPLARLSAFISRRLDLKSSMIDKAPKIFAARLGFVLSAVILLVHLLTSGTGMFVLAGGLALFAGLECVFNICVGCYIYSWLIIPWLSRVWCTSFYWSKFDYLITEELGVVLCNGSVKWLWMIWKRFFSGKMKLSFTYDFVLFIW